MFWTNLFRKTGYFSNPFRDLFFEEFEKAGGPPATAGIWLLEDSPIGLNFAWELEDGSGLWELEH